MMAVDVSLFVASAASVGLLDQTSADSALERALSQMLFPVLEDPCGL